MVKITVFQSSQLANPVSACSRSTKRHNKTAFRGFHNCLSAAIALAALPSAVFAQQTGSIGTGLTGNYFSNTALSGNPVLTRVDALINFSWLTGSPDLRLAPGKFSVRWTGQIEAPYTGDYTFSSLADDGVRLTINGQQIIDAWNNHTPIWLYSSTIHLQAGKRYDVVMDYYDQSKLSYVTLWWNCVGGGAPTVWNLVPSRYLYPGVTSVGNGTITEPTPLTGTTTAPTNLRIAGLWNNGPTDVLTWDAVPGTAFYNVYQYDLLIATKLTQPTFKVPTNMWSPGLTYTVTAVKANGDETMFSNIVTAQGANNPLLSIAWIPPVPDVPKDLVATSEWNADKPRIRIAWHSLASSYTYNVYRNGVKVADGLWGLQYIDTNVTPGVTYKYTVSGMNLAGAQFVEGPRSASAQTVAPVAGAAVGQSLVVTQVVANDDSAVLTWDPVPGAADYRIYNTAKPNSLKYSGGGLSAEMNGLDATKENTLVVEAVDKLGPFQKSDGVMGPGAMDHSGQSLPVAINGQGDPSNIPNVLARSTPVSVTCRPVSLSGSQVFFDTFRNSQPFVQVARLDPAIIAANGGGPNNAQNGYVREYQNDKWTLRNYWGDMTNTQLFVMSDHFMDTVYDGGTPWSNVPIHNNNASVVMQPKAIADISGNKVLHVTFEVDAHFNGRRWCDVLVGEADDPLIRPDLLKLEGSQTATVRGNLAAWQIFGTVHTFDQLLPTGQRVSLIDTGWGPNSELFTAISRAGWDGKPALNGSALDLDKRHKFDLYLSRTKFRITENGKVCKEGNLSVPLPFSRCQVYFSHHVYHTENDRAEMVSYNQEETYWYNHRPWADERHWDNMGFEVLTKFPAAASGGTAILQ